MTGRQPLSHVRGVGVVMRHSRRCLSKQHCTCDPAYEAWVYDAEKKRKRRKTFPSMATARAWRIAELRRMYAVAAPGDSSIDKAYGHLRRTLSALDAVLSACGSSIRPEIRAAMDGLYQAEDKILTARMRALMDES